MNLVDGMIHDGLWDPYDNVHMGMCGEHCSNTFNITREQQDAFAASSFERALAALDSNAFADEVVDVSIPQRKGDPIVVKEDESPRTWRGADKLAKLRPAFKK